MDGGYSVWLRPTGFLNYRLVASGKTWSACRKWSAGLRGSFPVALLGFPRMGNVRSAKSRRMALWARERCFGSPTPARCLGGGKGWRVKHAPSVLGMECDLLSSGVTAAESNLWRLVV